MKYYNEIYKYIKNNHPEDVSLMLQPHNMMKEIKNSLSKFNVWFYKHSILTLINSIIILGFKSVEILSYLSVEF